MTGFLITDSLGHVAQRQNMVVILNEVQLIQKMLDLQICFLL